MSASTLRRRRAPPPPTRTSTIRLPSLPSSRATTVVALLVVTLLALLGGQGAASADDQPPGGAFVDDDPSVHEAWIEAIADEGVTRGCADTRFCPRRAVTRGEMAAFLVRGLDLPAATTDHFDDDAGHLFEREIDALAEAGITKGCGDGSRFCPDDRVTRGEMAAFLRRAGELPVVDDDRFTDDDTSVFEQDIEALAAAGITLGCNPPDNTRFCPDRPTRRGQMATFLGRFLELVPHDPPPRDPATVSVDDALWTWFPEVNAQARRIVDCESSFNPAAVNPAGFHGLFQIAVEYHRPAFERVTGVAWADGIYVPYHNARYARYLYDQTGSWRAWGCTP